MNEKLYLEQDDRMRLPKDYYAQYDEYTRDNKTNLFPMFLGNGLACAMRRGGGK
ncbi:hypothetical protein HMPREF3224_02082 [Anaerococcus hydrogenalis]|nr:hypothetical protein HMPREF3224_02082 [Anaerococcus hydrogenalis]